MRSWSQPVGTPMQPQDPHAPSRCGAKARTTGAPCRNPPVRGATRCRMHGGTQPVGIASPNFKTGLYSRSLRGPYLELYERALADPELTKLEHDLALLDSRL